MAHRQHPQQSTERRVLVLAVPDVLDTTLAMWPDGQGARPHFLSCTDPVDGATECTSCGEFELATASRDVAERYQPTHLVVRDGSGQSDDVERCRLFLRGALAGASSTVRCVIQTHPAPRTPSTASYDAWLKRDAGVRPGSSLDIVWHEPLTTMFQDCHGVIQSVDDELAWRRATTPARTITRWLRDAAPHNVEFTSIKTM